MQTKGFTLIELLVVIAIIGLLATMSVVSFSTSREKGRISKGSSLNGQLLRGLGDELVARWDFDECSGTTFIDSSGNNRNITIPSGISYNATSPTGQGCSMYTDGATSQLTVTNVPIATAHTKSMWVYIVGSVATGGYLIDEGSNNNWLQVTGNRFRTGTIPSAGNFIDNTQNITSGKWYFVAVSFDGTKLSLYIDGSLDISANVASQAPATTVTIGNYGGGGSFRPNAYLNDIRIFNKILTAQDIQQLYAQGLPQHIASKR